MEYVVTEDETGGVVADEIFANDECLGESIGGRLLGIGKVDSVVGAVTELTLETGEILRSRDNEDISYSGKH